MLKYQHLAKKVKTDLKSRISRIIPGITYGKSAEIVNVVHETMNHQRDIFQEKINELTNHWMTNSDTVTILWKSTGGYSVETYSAKEKNRDYIQTRLNHCHNLWIFESKEAAERFKEKELEIEIDLEAELQENVADEEEIEKAKKELREIVAMEVLPAYAAQYADQKDAVQAAFDLADEFIRQTKKPVDKILDENIDTEIEID